MNIDRISLSGVLPRVFAGAENDEPVCRSQVWLRDVELHKGKFYLIEAESGTGKSSLCSFIYGNRIDYQGTIRFNDIDIRSLNISQWCDVRRRSIALLPQEMRIFPELTAWENVQIKNRLTSALPDDEIRRMFTVMEIDGKIDTPASRLSIGQQQRVAIIRTLCQPFSFLFLDEPVSHLDSRNNLIAAHLIAERAASLGAAVVSTSVGNPLLVEGPVTHIAL